LYKSCGRIDGRAALPRGLGGGAPPPYQSNLTATLFIDPLYGDLIFTVAATFKSRRAQSEDCG